jgi:phosphate-selective porin OprO/OprP
VKRSNWRGALGAALTVLVLAPSSAPAEDDGKSVNEKILDILLEKGDITPQRYEELREEALEEQRQAEAAATTPAVSAAADAPDGWKAYWKDGTRIERNDGAVKIKIGGRIQADAVAVGVDNSVENFADQDPDFDNPEGTGVDFRRARLFVSGSFWEHGIFKAQYDFAGTDADFKDVYAGLQKIPVVGKITFGHQYEPFSLSQQTSSKYMTFMARSLPVLTFTAERNTGLKIQNTALDERMTWSVGGFRDVQDSGEAFSNQGDYNVGARITGLPIWEDDGRRFLHVGTSYRHEFGNDKVRAFGPRPEVNTIDPVNLTGDLIVDGVDIFGGELATVCGPFAFESEILGALVDRSSMSDLGFWGASGQVSYFLTGEQRVYDRKNGAFGRTAPNEDFSISKGTWGAFEVAARYSYLDLKDDDVRGAMLSSSTLGVNWYLYRNLRLMVNGGHTHINGLGDILVGQSRVAIDF